MARRSLRRTRPRLVFVPASPISISANKASTASIEDALSLVLESLQGGKIGDSPLFDGRFNINIKLNGDQWNGEFNYKLAEFVIRIQRQILSIYNQSNNKKLTFASLRSGYDELIVNVRVDRGCTFVKINIENCLKYIAKIADGMDSSHKTIVLCSFFACVLIGSCYVYGKNADTQIELAQINAQKEIRLAEEKTRQQYAEIVTEGKRAVGHLVEPMEHLASSMRGSDTVTVGEKSYSKPEAEEVFRSVKKVESAVAAKTYKIDGEYDITDVALKQRSIVVVKEGKRRTISTRFLSDEEITHLHDIYREAQIVDNYPRNIDLQINLAVQDGKWDSAMVVGLGEKRPGSITIGEAIENSKPVKVAQKEQASLFPGEDH
ncbi:MAG: hypothetical protein F8N36_08170 [Desulfovibrio sp.]|uniref:hypothetical protein n=1 Tax=Desulfovibrio sp. TaxID=885 RepID=UPI00135E1EAA|nr:hypothetical protein [Desulfovibrio sp.]MTJ92822.1 hypothetical protein [Desulfovibrio sp.]